MAFDPTKPANNSPRSSAEIRALLAALARAGGSFNWVADPTMLIWASGDAAAPTHYVLSGTGATIARVGLGHATDTKRKQGDFSAKVTGGAATAKLMQELVPSAAAARANIAGAYVGAGAWAWASVGSSVRLQVDDGAAGLFSAYHSGSSAWEWLSIAGQLDAAAPSLKFGGNVAAGTSGWFSGFTFTPGDVAPSGFVLPRTIVGEINFTFNGPVSVTTNKARKIFQRPGIVKNVLLGIETAPTGASLIVDIRKDIGGGSWQSLFNSGPPTITAGNFFGQSQPVFATFADYHRGCFRSASAAASLTNARLRFDVTQKGSTVAGSDLVTSVLVLQFPHAWEQDLPYFGVV